MDQSTFNEVKWTLLKPERTQNPERAQNVLKLCSGFSTERTLFILLSKKVRSGFSTERYFQNFRFGFSLKCFFYERFHTRLV